MNAKRLIAAVVCIFCCSHSQAQSQDMDQELSDLTEKLATQIKDHGKKKVTVLDFTDLQGGASELGKYVAEQLTVDFVVGKRDFAVLDRANLKSILAEHKLTSDGLVNPENAKQLGKFAGVDALILGTLVPISQGIELTAKVITTDTAEIIGAARARFKSDETVKQLLAHSAETTTPENASDEKKEGPSVIKTFGDAHIEIQPLRIVNGSQYELTMVVTNRNAKSSIWVALNMDYYLRGNVTDSEGFEFPPATNPVSGIALLMFNSSPVGRPTEIRPGESITALVKYSPPDGRKASPGTCRLKLEFILANESSPQGNTERLLNLVTKIEAH